MSSTVTNPSTQEGRDSLSQEELNEIFNELRNNKEIKELLQTMEEVKKGNIESNKENINNFAKKMREMNKILPGSEDLMKTIEVISVLHEKIFSYASRFRLYSLEFWNLYSI
jgi:cell division protein FtsX